MNKFSVGNPVKTTESWLARWVGPQEFTGIVEKFRSEEESRLGRTVYVKLDEPFGPFSGLWFNPDDLEIDV